MSRRMGMSDLLRSTFPARCMAWQQICTRCSFRLLERVRVGRDLVQAADFQGEDSVAEGLVAVVAGRFKVLLSALRRRLSVRPC